MRVLEVNSVCGRQSTGRIASGIQTALTERGHECSVAFGEANSVAKRQDYHIGNEVSRYIHAGKSRVLDNAGFSSGRATQKFVDYIKGYDPDVIHLHNLHGYYLNIKILFDYLKKADKPVVWTLHDCWSFTGHCAHFDLVGCDKWKTACAHCPQKTEYPKSILLDRSAKNYAAKKELFTSVKDMTIVTPSNWLAEIVKQSFLQKYPVKVLPNGIDTSVFKPTESDLRVQYGLQEKIVLLGVANPWTKRKGLSDFIKLSNELDDRYAIVVIGVDEDQKKMLSEIPSVIALGATDNAETLAAWYTEADFFVNLTYEDNFPTVNLEALACGTPVITYDTGGSKDCLAEKCGICVPQGDYKAIVSALEHLQTDAAACVKRGREYEDQIRFAEYVTLFEDLVQKV